MRITDYESARSLTDVGLVLTRDEAEELAIYLHRMLQRGEFPRAFLTECGAGQIERELTISIDSGRGGVQLTA